MRSEGSRWSLGSWAPLRGVSRRIGSVDQGCADGTCVVSRAMGIVKVVSGACGPGSKPRFLTCRWKFKNRVGSRLGSGSCSEGMQQVTAAIASGHWHREKGAGADEGPLGFRAVLALSCFQELGRAGLWHCPSRSLGVTIQVLASPPEGL